jgi:hypothetical protein
LEPTSDNGISPLIESRKDEITRLLTTSNPPTSYLSSIRSR